MCVVKHVRDHIQAIALAMLLALLGVQLAQAVHLQDHDPVLEQVENCVACKIAADTNTADEPASLHAPIHHFTKVSSFSVIDGVHQSRAIRPPGRAPPVLLSIQA